MDKLIRTTQKQILNAFSKNNYNYALAGGTALELYYLNHRYSNDLDFFSSEYDEKNIDKLLYHIQEETSYKIDFDNEFITENKAKVKFYIIKINDSNTLKIDFIEDVFFDNPTIREYDKVPVYDVEHIYYQKIIAISGTYLRTDETGRERLTGRNEAKDIVDLFYMSKKVLLLHKFLQKMPNMQQRGIITWYRSFSRQDLALNVLDLDIYDKNFDSSLMINHIESEIKQFIEGIL